MDDVYVKKMDENKEEEVEKLKRIVKIENEYSERLKNSNVIGIQALIGNYYLVLSI